MLVYSVLPLPANAEASDWSLLSLHSTQLREKAVRRRRRKRASCIVDSHLQARSGAKMKALVGRQAELQEV